MAADLKANFEIVLSDFGTYSGVFRVTSFEFGCETEEAATFSLSLESTCIATSA